MGRFAVQLAAGSGAHVTAVARDGERAEGLSELGAEQIVHELEPEGERFDLILESVGGPSLAAAVKRVAPGGVVVSFGDSSGEQVSFGARDFYRNTGATLYAFLIFSELDRRGTGSADLERLARLIAAGELDPGVSVEASWTRPAPCWRRCSSGACRARPCCTWTSEPAEAECVSFSSRMYAR